MVRYPIRDPETDPDGPRLGLVIGSAGVRSFAALPVLEMLEQAGVAARVLVGSGVGSLVAALWATGFHASDAMLIARHHFDRRLFRPDLRTLLGIPGAPGGRFSKDAALFKPDRYRSILDEIFAGRLLEDLTIRTVLMATDLEAVTSVPLSAGPIADAVYASSAGFPFLPPARLDGRWLVEGAWTAPLPLLQAGAEPADAILATTFQRKMVPIERGFWEFFASLAQQNSLTIERAQTELAEGVLRQPRLILPITFKDPIGWWDFAALPEILEGGRAAADRARPDILRLAGRD